MKGSYAYKRESEEDKEREEREVAERERREEGENDKNGKSFSMGKETQILVLSATNK
jgi:hypothetical protein